MAKVGRKSKYDECVKPHLKQIAKWKRVGATDEQICEQLSISKTSFYEYQKQYAEFADAIKKGKTELVMDLRGELARIAFKHTLETKKQYIKQDEETGNKTQYTEITTKEVDGDIAAINLLLKNLDDNWSNDPQNLALRKQELELRKAIAEANNFDLSIGEEDNG
jgi:hypothetical protein